VGTRGPVAKRNRIKHEVVPADHAPPTPAALGPTGEAAWSAIWGSFTWTASIDRSLVERYCRLLDQYEELVALLAASGWTARGSRGQPVVHPHAEALRAVEIALQRHEERLGIGPLARARLGIAIADATRGAHAVRRLQGEQLPSRPDPRLRGGP
jgi:P27 family predicted phage terminase small subunit